MASMDQEYNNILTLTTQTFLPPAHSFIPIGAHDKVNLCHQLTLAQGRVLYNVYDVCERSDRVGIVVPTHILAEVNLLTRQPVAEQWRTRGAGELETLERTLRLVLKTFPRMPEFGAQKVAMTLTRTGGSASSSAVEDAVVQYALLNWTSYRLRLEQANSAEEWRAARNAKEAVRPRLRSVLSSWLPLDMTDREQLAFCRIHDLLSPEEAGRSRGVALTNLGGKETVANFAFR